MNRAPFLVRSLSSCLLASLPAIALAQAQQRPIEDFLAAQLVGPPTDFTLWSDPIGGGLLLFDAFGKFNTRFGLGLPTSINGRVTVRTLASGRAHVSVLVHTANAACWGAQPPGLNDNAFGYRPATINPAAGRPAALGHGTTRIEFEMPSPDTPLPSYFAIGLPPYEVVDVLATTIDCDGVLHAASGYPEGTQGKAHTTQVGLFTTGVPSGCPPEHEANCFPAEIVSFRPTGR